MNKANILFLGILLCSCETLPNPVVTKTCNPPIELLQKEVPPAPITKQTLNAQEVIEYWLEDDAKLNSIILDKNALIDHINKFCR